MTLKNFNVLASVLSFSYTQRDKEKISTLSLQLMYFRFAVFGLRVVVFSILSFSHFKKKRNKTLPDLSQLKIANPCYGRRAVSIKLNVVVVICCVGTLK